ncbi:MAG TPA: GNAT family N-acetyltransferase [Pseudolabrys sp.]|nr:GNAT family N-acetyltransferase [Pseudolabrys sp.]
MAQAVPARLDAHFGVDPPAAMRAQARSPAAVPGDVRLSVYEDLAAIEKDWRAFEAQADSTVFQSFDWLATWQRHIGAPAGVAPAIVAGRDVRGNILFLLPLSVTASGFARELTWLGSDLCDYNAPLLAPGFAEQFDRARFIAVWRDITANLQSHPHLGFDLTHLSKMPEMVGAQPNPMRYLGGTINPSGAYLTHLTSNWETFYAAKRSSSTRRRDRTKRKRLGELGEVKLINPAAGAETDGTLKTLMVQKSRSFARMGVDNLFARPGHAEFYRAIATDPATRHMVHVSRLDVGAVPAAINLGLSYRDCYYHLLASYDDGEVSRFGPGAAHLHDLMQFAIERGLKIFDFTIGDERYKRDWCDTELKLFDVIAAENWRGEFVAMPMLAKQRLKRWIKHTPVLWSAVSGLRAFAGALRQKLRG